MTWKQDERERLLRILAGATFLIFFQAYMVAPLIPRLAAIFSVSEERIGLIVPAYMIPYGIATLFYGVLAWQHPIEAWARARVERGSLEKGALGFAGPERAHLCHPLIA